MTTKLTLSVEQEVIESAKKYAHLKGRSLSELVESYLKALTSQQLMKKNFSPRTKRLVGSVKLEQGYDYKQMLEEEINRKHGL
ncbi:MAG: hypothetical protein H7Y03_07905 [Chitinophagaceae bacterium]|nr:hypothetical protein [Chitinophagaceae bacterium]